MIIVRGKYLRYWCGKEGNLCTPRALALHLESSPPLFGVPLSSSAVTPLLLIAFDVMGAICGNASGQRASRAIANRLLSLIRRRSERRVTIVFTRTLSDLPDLALADASKVRFPHLEG